MNLTLNNVRKGNILNVKHDASSSLKVRITRELFMSFILLEMCLVRTYK